jgi:iron complex outermembrane recepter protein
MNRVAILGIIAVSPFVALPGVAEEVNAMHGQELATPHQAETAITAARLKQPLDEAPAAVTVITSKQLREYNIRSIAEAMRLVPGMQVNRGTSNDYRINYLGGNILVPKRLNVLIDGVSAYLPAFAKVSWEQLPVSIEMVERIEVVRGPNSASFGPNSMLAIVNIITKHAADVDRGAWVVRAGTEGESAITAQAATALGASQVAVTLERENTPHYAEFSRLGRADAGVALARATLRVDSRLSSATSLQLGLGKVTGRNRVPFVEAYQISAPHQIIDDLLIYGVLESASSQEHSWKVVGSLTRNDLTQRWNTCVPNGLLLPESFNLWRANPRYARDILAGRRPSGGSAQDDVLAATLLQKLRQLGATALQRNCGEANQDELQSRADLELEHTWTGGEGLRLVTAVGIRREYGRSETFLQGAFAKRSIRAMTNAEQRIGADIVLHAGAYVEDDSLNGTSIAPRIAINYRVDPTTTLRLTAARGLRSPDIGEQRIDWRYHIRNLQQPVAGGPEALYYQSALASGNLSPERNDSFELGVVKRWPAARVKLDSKLFSWHLSQLISEKLQVTDFRPSNRNSVRLVGVENQLQAQLAPTIDGFVNYTYMDQRSVSIPLESTQYSRHSGAVGASWRPEANWSLSLAYYGNSGNGVLQSTYGRLDASVSWAGRVGASAMELRFGTSWLRDRRETIFRDIGIANTSAFRAPLQVNGSFAVRF